MNRNRETRNNKQRSNGMSRRRHRNTTQRHSPEEDEPVRLRNTNRSSADEPDDDVDDGNTVIKPVDEVIGFSVPRKARSVLRRFRENSSSNVSISKKTKGNESKQNPQEGELEIEIAEVLYGLRTQSRASLEKESDSLTDNAIISNSAAAFKGKRLVQESKKLGISSTAAVLEFNGPTNTEDLFPISVKNAIANSEGGISSSVTLDFANLEASVKDFPSPSIKPGDGEVAVTKVNSTSSEDFGIDLTAPLPQMRSAPQRESDVDFVSVAADAEKKTIMLTQDKDKNGSRSSRDELLVEERESKKARLVLESDKSDIPMMIKDRSFGLELNLEKDDRENNSESLSANHRSHQHVQKQVKIAKDQYPYTEKTAQFSSLHLPMSVSSWPGGLPTIGYMAPLQGVVSMDGSQVPPTPVQPLFSQPRPKRCGTHCYIARNIHGMQQFMKINPFWPVMSSMQDKGQGLPVFPGQVAKETAQNQQQILLQHGLPPGTPANMMHGPPAFIFPFNQQQAAAAMAAASVRPGPAPVTASTSASVDGSAAAAPTPAAMSLNYPNMPSIETQYLALLQNNAYPFPIPAPNFSGTHPQPIPFFYPSQMIHPNMPHQHIQPGQPNPSISNSPSSQKHNIQSQSQPGNGNINGFSSPKTGPPHYSQNYGAVNSTQGLAGNSNGNNIRDENKKQQSEKHNSKPGGVEGSPQTFATSFSSMNGGGSAHKNNDFFQKILETDKRTYQVMQAAAVAQAALNKKNNSKVLEEGKNAIGGDSSKIDEQRKGLAPKPLVSSANDQGGSRKFVPSNSSQLQNMQFQQQHFMAQFQKQQLQMQHQFVAANSNDKAPPTSNGDRLATSSPSTASKFTNTISSNPQNLVQNSTRIASQGQSLSTSLFKNVPQQQQAKPQQQSQTHVSFGSGQKSQPVRKGLQPPQGVASPITPLPKEAAEMLRKPSSNSQGNKASSVSSNVKAPSILGNPNNVASSDSSTKSLVQQQYQQRLKQMANNQPQLFFSPAYMQTQPPQSTSNTANKTNSSTKGSCPAGVQVRPTSEQKQPAGNREPLTRK